MPRPGAQVSNASLWLAFAAFIFCSWALSLPASAEVVGMRLTINSVDDASGEVSFDVTALHTNRPQDLMLGRLLDRDESFVYTTYLPNYYGLGGVDYRVELGVQSDWNTFPHPVVNYGDNQELATATLAYQGTETIGSTTLISNSLFNS